MVDAIDNDDFDLDDDLDEEVETPGTGVEGESTNQPEFGTEDEDLDDIEDEEEDLSEEEILRRAMADDLDEADLEPGEPK